MPIHSLSFLKPYLFSDISESEKLLIDIILNNFVSVDNEIILTLTSNIFLPILQCNDSLLYESVWHKIAYYGKSV